MGWKFSSSLWHLVATSRRTGMGIRGQILSSERVTGAIIILPLIEVETLLKVLKKNQNQLKFTTNKAP